MFQIWTLSPASVRILRCMRRSCTSRRRPTQTAFPRLSPFVSTPCSGVTRYSSSKSLFPVNRCASSYEQAESFAHKKDSAIEIVAMVQFLYKLLPALPFSGNCSFSCSIILLGSYTIDFTDFKTRLCLPSMADL